MMSDTTTLTDSLGRQLEVKTLSIVDQFDLLEAARNQASYTKWFGLASLVFSCTAIDNVPLPMPTKPDDFKKNAAILKNEGLQAIARYISKKIEESEEETTSENTVETAKN